MIFVDIKQFKKLTDAGRTKAVLKWEEHQQTVYFSKVRLDMDIKTSSYAPVAVNIKQNCTLIKTTSSSV